MWKILIDIDKILLHLKHKVELYAKCILFNISWDLTVADVGVTWVKQTWESTCNCYIRQRLNISINGTFDIVTLSEKRFGLDIISVSTKFLQCQNTRGNCLKTLHIMI